MYVIALFIYFGGWPCDLFQGQSIQGQGRMIPRPSARNLASKARDQHPCRLIPSVSCTFHLRSLPSFPPFLLFPPSLLFPSLTNGQFTNLGVIIDHFSGQGTAVGHVRPSACLFPVYFEPTAPSGGPSSSLIHGFLAYGPWPKEGTKVGRKLQ